MGIGLFKCKCEITWSFHLNGRMTVGNLRLLLYDTIVIF